MHRGATERDEFREINLNISNCNLVYASSPNATYSLNFNMAEDWPELTTPMHSRLCMMRSPNKSSGTRNISTARDDDDDGHGGHSLVHGEGQGGANSLGRGIAFADDTLRIVDNPNLPTHRRFADMERSSGAIFGDGDERDSRTL